ncbi:ankyrin repeat domain-containing protein [Flavobacteriaceae bacterium MHTCC 0001]
MIALTISAQDNVFLDRAYWKQNPTLDQVKADIKAGNDPTQLNRHAFDAVSWALIEKVDNKIVKYLLTIEGNGVNKKTHDGRTYIFWAAYKDNLKMMQYLVDSGAKTDIIDSHGYSLLNFAAVTGQLNPKLYDFCIAHGSNVLLEKNHDGANALLLVAPFLKDDTLIDYFITKGLDLHSVDDNGNGIFNYATKKGNEDLLNLLITKGVAYKSLNKQGGNAFMFAVKGTRHHKNTLETYKYLEKLGLQPNITTDNGFTPLHALAYKNKDLDIFNYFIEKGVDVNQKDVNGNTAFINASYSNSLKTISFLSEHVENINDKNKKGITPLMRAVESNSEDIVSFLLEKGADISMMDDKGNTLLYYLIVSYSEKNKKSFSEKMNMLKRKGLDFSTLQSNSDNIWHMAVKQNNINLLKKLERLYVPINHKNKYGYTPLHIAAMKATDNRIIKFLLEHGADKRIKTDFDETPLDLAKENELLQENNSSLTLLEI